MQSETSKIPARLRLSYHLQRQLVIGLLIAMLGIVTIVAGLGLVYLKTNQGTDDNLIEAGRFVYDEDEYLFLMVPALGIWSLASIAIMYRLLIPIFHDLDQFEGVLMNALQTSLTSMPVAVPSRDYTYPRLILPVYREFLNRLAHTDSPQLLYILETVSHELRSPLAAIMGYAALLADQATQPSAAAIERYAHIIVKQTEWMNQLLESTVTTARIVEGRLELNRTALNLGPLMGEVIAEARLHSQREILWEDQLNLETCVGDPLRMRQVFANLIENAVKYSGPDTPVRVTLRPAQAGSGIEISVHDQGIGITPDELPLLFTRFGRIRKPETLGIQGHGLGLYIVKHIVESHDGSIVVHSQPGQGTAFVVRLPASTG